MAHKAEKAAVNAIKRADKGAESIKGKKCLPG